MIPRTQRHPYPSAADRAADPLRYLATALDQTFVPDHEPSHWLRSRLAALQAHAGLGHLRPCPHLRPGKQALIALWAADRIVCSACMASLEVTGDANHTCDRCGVVADVVHPAMVALGPAMLIAFGLCAGCLDREAGR